MAAFACMAAKRWTAMGSVVVLLALMIMATALQPRNSREAYAAVNAAMLAHIEG